ncbi:bestrophin family protein [Xanthocytophaga flava]|uniref:bestrophin family protein n=1 Tax=Xanthocytophaga flava TaxID=3048013 RepID=UPI0028D3B217|nr:bestrophin family ion channel [Xanthocytophaga flavus]MDJ1471842.1 bestrophin family ion channel [Xanthocytophaga flavus]
MILKQKFPWSKLLFTFRHTSLQRSGERILAATGVAIIVTVIEVMTDVKTYTLTAIPFTIMGVAISIFLGFRNNTAYDRFWEGRILWGQLVNVSRSFARQIITLVVKQPASLQERELDKLGKDGVAVPEPYMAFQQELVRMIIAHVHSLRHLLRDTTPDEELKKYLSKQDLDWLNEQPNVTLGLLQRMGEKIQHAWQKGWIHDFHLPVLEASLTEITAIQGGCERIKNTPFPVTYVILGHRIVAFFCFFLPFGIVDTAGVLTPLVVFLVSLAFFGLDAIGEEIEDPFGTEPHHLPLSALCTTIERNLLGFLQQKNLPAPAEPVDNVLI